jgi:DNA-binding NarL/FixJ family response regulator
VGQTRKATSDGPKARTSRRQLARRKVDSDRRPADDGVETADEGFDVVIVARRWPLAMASLASLVRQWLGEERVTGPVPWDEAIETCERRDPRVVVVEGGSETARDVAGELSALLSDLNASCPHAKAVVFEEPSIDRDAALVDAVWAGAAGIVHPEDPPEELLSTLRALGAGGVLISPEQMASLAEHAEHERRWQRELARRLRSLTVRERDVLYRLAAGRTNDEIASDLGISPRTVEKHVEHILVKVSARSRLEAVAILTRQLQST